MLDDILFAFWFMLPAATANGAPIIFAHLPLFKAWNTPIDFGASFRGKPLFGSHKTWRGIVSGVLVATAVLAAQQWLSARYSWTEAFTGTINYEDINPLILGPVFGLGALGGDAVKSFFKRRRGTEAGARWIPFDQLDYIIGVVIVTLPFVVLSLRQYVLIFVMWFIMHIFSTIAGWSVGLKDQPV